MSTTGQGEGALAGQTVVVIGGSAGIGFATAKRARDQGAEAIITARDPDRVQRAALELGAESAAFDATDFDRLQQSFGELSGPIHHVLVTGLTLIGALTAAMPALVRNLALEVAPVRVNLIAAGFVDTPLSAALLGDQLDDRREQLRSTLPIRRVVGPDDIAAVAVHLMTNTAVTGATFDVDGGQQLVEH
jgi:NAD(P)-dependent dehydrogenase (short-subunit alcohol dehydrogenase family)